jgi:Bacterial Ig-like domain
MSGGSDNVHPQGGPEGNFQDIVPTGHAQIESSYDQIITPVRKQFGPELNVPVQLENIPCSVVIIQNPLGNDPIYVGGIGAHTPYFDRLYPGDYRGTIIYEGMSVSFRVRNANRIQVVGTPTQSFNYRAYPNVTETIETSEESPPNPDTTGPVVSSTIPADSETGVILTAPISITMNEPILPASVDTTTVAIDNLGGLYDVFLDPLDNTVIHIETGAAGGLDPNTTYTVTLAAGGLKDISENPIENEFTFSFSSITTDITPPTVQTTDPANSATGVVRDKTISITMSEPILSGSVSNTTVTMSPSVTRTTFLDGADPSIIKIDPASDLAASTAYTITVQSSTGGGVKDLAGNAIASNFAFSFTTAAPAPPADTTPPTITARSPDTSATNVDIGADVVITFSEPLRAASVTTSTVELFQGVTKITAPVTLESNNTVVRMNPSTNLSYSTVYTVFVRTGVEDVALNNIAAQASWSFTTEAPLTITNRTPAVDATGVVVDSNIVIDFDAALSTGTVTADSVELFDTSTEPDTEVTCTRTFSNGNTRLTVNPGSDLKYSTVYQVFVRSTVADVNGDTIFTTVSWFFTTQSQPLTLLYNISGTGSWRPFGDGTEIGRGLQITSTNTSASNTLHQDTPKQLTCRIRRVGSSGWTSRDDAMYCRIRDSDGDLKGLIGTYTDARTITTSSSGQDVFFDNSGQNYQMTNGDCIFVEYEDGDSSHHFEINHTSSSVTSHCEEVFYGDDGSVHTGSSSRDMGATIQGID